MEDEFYPIPKEYFQTPEEEEEEYIDAYVKEGPNGGVIDMDGSYENSLEFCYPDIAEEWDYSANGYLAPSDVAKYSNRIVGWICIYGHTWKKSIKDRTLARGQCPDCKTIKKSQKQQEYNRNRRALRRAGRR